MSMTVKTRVLCRDCHMPVTALELRRRFFWGGRCTGCCTARMERDAAAQVARHGAAVRYSK